LLETFALCFCLLARSQCKSHTRSLAPELPSQKESPVCKVLGARTRRAFNRLKPHVPISNKRARRHKRERRDSKRSFQIDSRLSLASNLIKVIIFDSAETSGRRWSARQHIWQLLFRFPLQILRRLRTRERESEHSHSLQAARCNTKSIYE
jgi:hypothetical protein